MSSSFINAFGSTRECFMRTMVNSSDNETSSSFQCHGKKLTENQKISNKMIFLKDFVVNGDLIVDYVKGKAIKNLVTLDTEQVIKNNLMFHERVIVKSNIDHLKFINNINLMDWYGRSVFVNREQEINGLWTTKGTIKAQYINGRAILDTNNLKNVSKIIEKNKMMIIKKKNETEIEYFSRCHEVEELSKELIKLPYLFHQFEVVHVVESKSIIESVIFLKIASSDYLIVTLLNECFSTMYKWSKENSTFIFLRNINIGPITKWLVSYHYNLTYLITSSLHSTMECEKNRQQGNIWIFEENSEKYIHLFTGNAFSDIIQANNASEKFYTLEENGSIFQWIIKEDKNVENKFLVNVGEGNYRFIDYNVLGKLAVSNGKEIKEINLNNQEIVLSRFFIANDNIVALPFGIKVLTALILKDKIVIYENLRDEKIFCILQTYKAGSVLWFNYGFQKQAFLIVSSHHKLIEIFEYKSVSGFIKRMSLQLFSTRLESISLPLKRKYQLAKFVVVIQKNKVIFLKADMLGDFYEGSNSLC